MTKFERIKNKINELRNTKIRAETLKESLKSDNQRLFREANEVANADFENEQEIEQFSKELNDGIFQDVTELEKVLNDEGVDF